MRTMTLTTARNVPFTVMFLDATEVGPNRFRHNGKGMHDTVEFYDGRYVEGFTEWGQFASSYNLSDIMENDRPYGIMLQGGEPSWQLDADSVHLVQVWLRDIIAELNAQAERDIDAKLGAS